VHDDRLAQLLEQLKRLRDERREYEREVAALETFLREEEVPAPETLAERRAEIAAGRSEVQARLTAVTAEAMSSTDFAEDLRARYGRARSPAAQAAACVRDREALVDRCATGSPTSWTDAQSPTSAAANRGHPGHAPLHGAPPPRAPLPHKVATPGSASGTRGREGPDHVQLPLVRDCWHATVVRSPSLLDDADRTRISSGCRPRQRWDVGRAARARLPLRWRTSGLDCAPARRPLRSSRARRTRRLHSRRQRRRLAVDPSRGAAGPQRRPKRRPGSASPRDGRGWAPALKAFGGYAYLSELKDRSQDA
jgi:hypothetical protein